VRIALIWRRSVGNSTLDCLLGDDLDLQFVEPGRRDPELRASGL
jgi:hypothetical protein